MFDDYDYNQAPEANEWTETEQAGSDLPYELDHPTEWERDYDEDYEIEKSERNYERYIGRS